MQHRHRAVADNNFSFLDTHVSLAYTLAAALQNVLFSTIRASDHMDRESIFSSLTTVLRDVFDDDKVVATADLHAQLIEGWDSLTNVLLFVEIERVFSVRFSASEMSALRNVGDLASLLEEKTRFRD
jgi:acyl carrier protein